MHPHPFRLNSSSVRPVFMYLSNDGQLGIHMFHVKPWADTITFGAVSDTLSSPRVMGSPVSATVFHVKHDC